MFSLAIKNSKKNLWRTSLLISGIAFSVCIMVSASILMDSAQATFFAHFEEKAYNDLEIQSTTSETFSFTPELESLLSSPRIAKTNMVLERIFPLEDVYTFFTNATGIDPGFRVVGFSGIGPETDEIDERYWPTRFSTPPSSPEDYVPGYRDVIIDGDIMIGTNVGLGMPLPASIIMNFTSRPNIAHVIRGDRIGSSDEVWEAFFNIELLWDSWDPEIRPVSSLRIKLKDWTQVFEVKEDLESLLGSGFSIISSKKISKAQFAGIHSYEDATRAVVLLSAAVEFLLVFSLLIVIVFSERRAEMGQLRVLGMTRSRILMMILLESLILGFIGSLIGAFFGLVGSILLTRWYGIYSFSTEVVVVIDYATLAAGMTYGILITLIAALLPSAYIAYQPMQQSLYGYQRSANKLRAKSSVFFIGSAILFFLIGLELLAQVKSTDFMTISLFMDYSLPIGVILLSAIFFEVILIRLLIPLFEKTWPFPGYVRSIASRSILRSFRRNCAAMITAALGISFVITASIFAASLQKTLPEFLEGSSIAEVIMDSGEGNEKPISLLDNITSLVPEVQEVGYALGSQLYVNDMRTSVVGINASLLYNSRSLQPPRVHTGPANAFQLMTVSSDGNALNCILSVPLAERLGVGMRDIIYITLPLTGNLVAFQVIALVEPTIFLNNGENLFVDYRWLSESSGLPRQARWFFLSVNSPREAYNSLRWFFSEDFYRIIPVYRQQERIKGTLEKQTVIFEVLLALVMFSSFIAQATAYLMAAIEREREVGIIRASGANQSQVLQVFVVESLMMMFTSLVVGIADAALLSALLFHIASTAPTRVYIVIPWAQIFIWLCFALLFSYVVSRIAFQRIKNLAPAETLRIANQ
jgi:putative ABC transport system permease protein